MNEQRTHIIWNMSGAYYDALMNALPDWIIMQNPDDFDQAVDDYIMAYCGA